MTRLSAPIKVLIVDDSALFRRLFSSALARLDGIEVIGTANGAAEARDFIGRRRPDVIALDVEMPEEDGLTFLKRQMAEDPIATVIVSSLSGRSARFTIAALEAGAVDVVSKPGNSNVDMDSKLPSFERIATCLRGAATARLRVPAAQRRQPVPQPARPAVPAASQYRKDWAIGIGSSTGGVQALTAVLPSLPATAPCVLVVQHMPEGFTAAFAKRLDMLCRMHVREAQDGDRLEPGTIFIAPGGDRHMRVVANGPNRSIRLEQGDPVCFSRPSVDVLFESLARTMPGKLSAAILTGMGRDGAKGLLSIRQTGGKTFAQDEATSQVYGMPARAWELGAASEQLPLDEIAGRLLACAEEPAWKAQGDLTSLT